MKSTPALHVFEWPRPAEASVWESPPRLGSRGQVLRAGAAYLAREGAERPYRPSPAQREALRARLESMPLGDADLARFLARYGTFGVPHTDAPATDAHRFPHRLEAAAEARYLVCEYRLAVELHAALREGRGRARLDARLARERHSWVLRLPEPAEGALVVCTRNPMLFWREGDALASVPVPEDPRITEAPDVRAAARAWLEFLVAQRLGTFTRWDFDGPASRRRPVLRVESAIGCAWVGLADAIGRGAAFRCVECGRPFTGSLRRKQGVPLYCGGQGGACALRAKRRRARVRELRADGRGPKYIARALEIPERLVRRIIQREERR